MSAYHAPLLRCFVGLVCFTSFCGARQHGAEFINDSTSSQQLAVVIPCYSGDLPRTVASLERWPTECSPVTLKNMDLVLYYAEGEEDNLAVTSAVNAMSAKAGQCFAKTKMVYANLDKEDNVYPNGPSAMFYKMYLDEDVRSHFIEYNALAIIEWDVLVASERSFEQLYHSAFQELQGFWVKGSRMEGADFHSNAEIKDMWKVLGHINGNAIYNNNDPEFVEYVRYTHARWELKYPYDVALWLTVSDFPYSWPLWQRYSSKFVTTNLISNVGREHVNHELVSDALELETLFIHGSHIEEGNIASIKDVKTKQRDLTETENVPARGRKLQPWRENEKWRRIEKWQTIEKWTTLEKWRADYGPEVETGCLSGCTFTNSDETRGRVCDLSCASGDPYGTLGCGAREGRFGANCRTCYYSVDVARRQDTPENRAIMCDTLEPVPSAYIRSLAFLRGTSNSTDLARDLRHIIRQKPENRPNDADLAAVFEDASKQPFGRELERGGLCAFIAARSDDVRQVEVTVMSILQFVPGVRVAIAAEENGFDAYKSITGIYPSVTVRSTPNASMASLFADDFCGGGTSLVYYVKPTSVLSRAFTSKDTHSLVGDLLVVYSKSPSCYSESTLVRQTNAILGFEAPTFICGTDLILPVGANADLRDLLASPIEMRTGDSYEMVAAARTKLEEVDDIFAIPQMLAAIVYEKKTPGVRFINPQAWVSEHLFKTVSIWEIPLVKPRFSCIFAANQGVDDVAGVMRRNLDFFTQGGTCDNGKMVHI